MAITTALKIGISVGLEIYDRTRSDPLNEINSKLDQIVAQSLAILKGIDTVQSTLVKAELADRKSDIQQALYNLREAQTNPDKTPAANVKQ